MITVTEKGLALREKAAEIPGKIGQCVRLKPEDAMDLQRILKVLAGSLSYSENS